MKERLKLPESSSVVRSANTPSLHFLVFSLDVADIDFGSFLVGKSTSKELQLQNSSLVPTSFEIEKVSDDGKDPTIKIDHMRGKLAPG